MGILDFNTSIRDFSAPSASDAADLSATAAKITNQPTTDNAGEPQVDTFKYTLEKKIDGGNQQVEVVPPKLAKSPWLGQKPPVEDESNTEIIPDDEMAAPELAALLATPAVMPTDVRMLGAAPVIDSAEKKKALQQAIAVLKKNAVKLDAKETVQTNKAIKDLLRKVENEFGVSAEKLVEAIARLEPEQLQQPAKQSIGAILNNLEIAPKDKPKLRAIFQKVLSEEKPLKAPNMEVAIPPNLLLASILAAKAAVNSDEKDDVKEQLKSPVVPAPTARVETIAKQQSQVTELKPFAPAPQSATPPEENFLQQFAVKERDDIPQPKVELADSQPPDFVKPMHVNRSSLPAATPLPEKNMAANKLETVSLDSTNVEPSKFEPAKFETFKIESLKTQSAQPVIQQTASSANVEPLAFTSMAKQQSTGDDFLNSGKQEKFTMQSFNKEGGHATTGRTKLEDDAGYEALTAQGKQVETDKDAARFFASKNVTPQAPKTDNEAVTQLVNNVKMMARDGGGEMRVQLRGELGDVNLRVAVNHGAVDVQMVTQSDHARKILESNLHDLKNNLVAQKFDVEQIKVNVATNSSSDFKDSKTSDWNQSNSHWQDAHQFMNQFREQNQDFRRMAFIDDPEKAHGPSNKIGDSQLSNVEDVQRRVKNNGRLDMIV